MTFLHTKYCRWKNLTDWSLCVTHSKSKMRRLMCSLFMKQGRETLVISIRSLWLLLTPGSIYRTWIIFSCMGFRTTYCKECIFSQLTLVCLDKEGRDGFQLLYRTVFGRQHREYTGERHSTLTGSTDGNAHTWLRD